MTRKPDYAGSLHTVRHLESEARRLQGLVDGLWSADDWEYASLIDAGSEDAVFHFTAECERTMCEAYEALVKFKRALELTVEGVRSGNL